MKLNLQQILKRKNPYLFKAKNLITPQDLVKGLLDAHLSSQEETLFGAFLEQLAIHVCSKTCDGRKSATEGIDLEFVSGGALYLVAVKSGPNWGNSSQITKMKDNFRKAKKILGTNAAKQNTVCVNGCCYGRDNKPDKGDYIKLCGERFWTLISGNDRLYLDIIKPLGYEAKEHDEAFQIEYGKALTVFAREVDHDFFKPDGTANWDKIVQFNAAQVELKIKRVSTVEEVLIYEP